MPGIKLTKEQADAVNARSRRLLVSAAAGAGKTRVLVERLLSLVCDPVDPRDIDEFLVITFTKAAAAEMRGRVIESLSQRLAEDPHSAHLRRQMNLVYRADITTIHSFCLSILRENAHLFHLSQDFRVADQTEAELMRARVLDELLEQNYAGMTDGDDFSLLVESADAVKNDRKLQAIITDTYMNLQSHPYPQQWMQAQLSRYRQAQGQDAGQTVWGGELLDYISSQTSYCIGRLRAALQDFSDDEKVSKGYGPAFESDIGWAGKLLKAAGRGWDSARETARGLTFARLAGIRGYEDKDYLDRIKAVRDIWKKAVRDFLKIMDCTSEQFSQDLEATYPIARDLFRLVADYEQAYAAEKRKYNVCDFTDLEHFAVQLLSEEEGGAPTAQADSIAARYREVLVDEYQDVSAVQESIIAALTAQRGDLFMVGDVKQSIYRFRLANPGIFLHKYRSYPGYDAQAEQSSARVILSRNFRSRTAVLSSINEVFRRIMTREAGEIDYTEEEFLYPGAQYTGTDSPAEFTLVDLKSREEGDEQELPGKTETEAAYTAQRIAALLRERFPVSDGAGGMRPVRLSDIVILMRSPSGKAPVFAAALEKASIPSAVENTAGDFFSSVEISVARSFLAVIDNPLQDVPLISVLRSPVFGFSADRLALIRSRYPQGTFYDAVAKASGDGDEACAGFLALLGELRLIAPELSVNQLVWHLYDRTDMLALFAAMPGGKERTAHLLRLLDYAAGFEKTSYKGLFRFLSFLTRMMEQERDFGERELPDNTEAVRIMSIHKSKGLEFPVVIIADCAKQFNTEDIKKPVLLHPELGPGLRRMDTQRMIEYDTLIRRSVAHRLSDEMMSEELRVLYVGMTRAREKLIMVGSSANADTLIKRAAAGLLEGQAAPQSVLNVRSMAEWLLMPLLLMPEGGALRARAGRPETIRQETGGSWAVRVVEAAQAEAAEPEAMPGAAEAPDDERKEEEHKWLDIIKTNLDYTYPYSEAVGAPSKVTATQLKGRLLDIEAAQDAPVRYERRIQKPVLTGELRLLTPAQRGIAVHLFMQFARFERCADHEGVREEIARLLGNKTLLPEQAGAIDPEKILRFFASPPGLALMASGRVMREFKFSVLAPGDRFGGLPEGSGEQVLLQGVVDCCYEEDGKLTVIDFKTDYVNSNTIHERALSYLPQIEAYAWALQSMTGRPVGSKILYFFAMDDYVMI